MLHFFQDEGTQENLAAGIQASFGFRGAIELSELGFELCALALQGLQGSGLAQIDGGELRFPEFGRRAYKPPTGGATVFTFGSIAQTGGAGITGNGEKTAEAIAQLAYSVFALGTFLPALGVLIRRLHDTNRSGWWVLISLVPFIGGIVRSKTMDFLLECKNSIGASMVRQEMGRRARWASIRARISSSKGWPVAT